MQTNNFIEKVKKALDSIPMEEIDRSIQLIKRATKVYAFGNGGSYALAQHFVADLNKIHIAAFCMPSSIAELTMWANDEGYESVFEKSLHVLDKNDVLIAISSSGESKNIIKAAEYAALDYGKWIIGFSGFSKENSLNKISHIKIHIPTEKGEYGVVESVHDAVMHLIIEKLKHAMYIV